ncbi:MAG: hypothetical protein ACLFTT_03245 [Candidatus Hydrogenedentota bacterium]
MNCLKDTGLRISGRCSVGRLALALLFLGLVLRSAAPLAEEQPLSPDEARRTVASYRTEDITKLPEQLYYQPTVKAALTDEERIAWLMFNPSAGVAGPEGLCVQLGALTESYDQPFVGYVLKRDDADFLRQHRAEVIERALERLDETGSRYSAFLLGWLEEERALPILRRRFIEARDFYGWESDWPHFLAENQFPHHSGYEKVIVHITGKPLEAMISLTDAEIKRLEKDCAASPHSSEGYAALYILLRLHPESARRIICRVFRTGSPRTRWSYAPCVPDVFEAGLDRSEVVSLLGAPDATVNERAHPDPKRRFAAEILWDTSLMYEGLRRYAENKPLEPVLHVIMRNGKSVAAWCEARFFSCFSEDLLAREEYVPKLLDGLASESADVVELCAEALTSVGKDAVAQAFPTLVEIFCEREDCDIDWDIVKTVEMLGPEARPYFPQLEAHASEAFSPDRLLNAIAAVEDAAASGAQP